MRVSNFYVGGQAQSPIAALKSIDCDFINVPANRGAALRLRHHSTFSPHHDAGGIRAEQKHAPLPDKLTHAKNVYLENSTGDQKLADILYSLASARKRWEFVTERAKADIPLILTYDERMVPLVTAGSATAIGRSATGSAVDIPIQYYVYPQVVDRETGDALSVARSRIKIGAS